MRVVLDGGEVIDLGTTETAPTIGIADYSRRVTDDFGVTTVVRRGFARRLSVRLAVPFDGVDALQRRLADLRAAPATWVADDRFDWLSARGFYKDFSLDLPTPSLSYCTLTVEGLAETETTADSGGDPAPDGQVSTLQLLQPVTITDAELAASSVVEADHPEWAADTAYPTGARVIKAATHRVYESVAAALAGDDPAGASGKWLDMGPTNRWAMFDQALGTVTSAAGSIIITLSAGVLNAVALLDVDAATVRAQAPGYDRTMVAGPGAVTFLDLPSSGGQVTVTIAGPGQVSVGTLLVGRLVPLGITEASPTAGITDYSRKEVDAFGEAAVVQRAWAKRMTAKALIRTDALDLVANRIAAVRAHPSLWIGQAGLDSLTVYGFFKDFSIEVGENVSKLSLSIEGLSTAAKVEPLKASVDWPSIGDPTGTKPADNADVTADNVAKDTAAVAGRPAEEVLAGLDRIEPITSDLSALEQAQVENNAAIGALGRVSIDLAAADRQAARDVGRLDEAALRAVLEAARTRAVLRDAGVVVDQSTGAVRIYAVDELAGRAARAEVTLDGQRALIASKASVQFVDEKILLAQLTPDQAAELGPLIARLTSAEQEIDGLGASVTAKAEAIEVTAVGGRVTNVEQGLDALAGVVTTKAERTVVDALDVRTGSVEQSLSALGNVSGLSVTIRQARSVADDAGEAALRAVLAGDNASRRRIAEAAELRQDLSARIVEGERAETTARLALAAQVGQNRALAVQETIAAAGRDNALGQRIDAVGAVTADQAAAIGSLAQASITAQGGLASLTTTVRQQARGTDGTDEALLRALITGDQSGRARAAQLVQIQTELSTELVAGQRATALVRETLLARMGAAEAAIVASARVATDANSATAARAAALEVAFGQAATDLATASASIVEEATIRAQADAANAEATALVATQINDPVTGLPATRAAVAEFASAAADADQATATAITQVSARLDEVEVGVEQSFDAVVDRLGRVEGTYTVKVDASGNVVGFQLIGSQAGPGSLNLINTDLRMGTGRVVFNNGLFMRVMGTGFGAAGDLISWFGPTMAIAECTRANAISFESIDGEAHYESVTAGTLSNRGGSSGLAVDDVAYVGPFGSNGGTLRFVASWTYRSEYERIYPATAAGVSAFETDRDTFAASDSDGDGFFRGALAVTRPASTVTLDRSFDGETYNQIGQRGFTTEQRTMAGTAPLIGDASGRARFTQSIGGGFTVNDPVLSTADRWLRLTLDRSFSFNEDAVQRLSITSTEE